MSGVFHYSSSLRCVALDETLTRARRIAAEVGITRVTEITRLDRIGMPVFAGIRPHAQVRSLCVSSGKGLTPDEARVGAYMEAIELAYAEPQRAHLRVFDATARDVLDGATRPDAIADLCPWEGAAVPASATLPCVEAEAITTGARVVVPAEVVMFPVMAEPMYFGSDGNGIASGNSIEEATVHGLTELIERDATSFLNAKDTSQLIYTDATATSVRATMSRPGAPLRDALPETVRELVRRLDREGFDLVLRSVPNPFGLPVIKAMIRERGNADGVHFGYACHLSRDIALARAVSEAIQCRLSVIHGGRDDLTRVFSERAEMVPAEKLAFAEQQAARNLDHRRGVINFDEVPDESQHTGSLEAARALLVERLASVGLTTVLRAVLTPPDHPLHVIRVIVPGLEMYAHGIYRMGPRLTRYLDEVSPGARKAETSPREASR